jgi:hypothetical protein
MLETDELLRPEEDESTKLSPKTLILEGEMRFATNLVTGLSPRSVFWRFLGHGVLLVINDSLECHSLY